MSVVIDDTPYPRFPITPREGLMLTIGGQKRVIDHIEVSLDTLEVRCDTRPWVPVTKPEQDKPAEEPPAKTNAEEPESTDDDTPATAEEISRRRTAGGGSAEAKRPEVPEVRSGSTVGSVGAPPRRPRSR